MVNTADAREDAKSLKVQGVILMTQKKFEEAEEKLALAMRLLTTYCPGEAEELHSTYQQLEVCQRRMVGF